MRLTGDRLCNVIPVGCEASGGKLEVVITSGLVTFSAMQMAIAN